ncbi:MAG TPA: ABC transporter substrate-binding protein [Xanthobacteraceae bacterium]
MKRRDFLTFLGGGAATWPLGARAQQPAKPRVGFLGLTSRTEWEKYVDAFLNGLKELGFVDGQNITIEYRWAEGKYDQLPAITAALVARPVDVLAVTAPPAVQAAKAATMSIPIVFFLGSDPVKLGLVANLNRPGGNITGVTALANSLNGKRLELLREVVHQPAVVGLLVNPTNSNVIPDGNDARQAAAGIAQPLLIVEAADDAGIDAAFKELQGKNVSALIINPDPFLLGRRNKIVALAAQDKIATIFHVPEPVAAGGLMSYGASFTESYRIIGTYVGRILKGEKPGDLPIPQPTKFEMVINLKTAKTLGLSIPPTLLALADEVIE